MTLATLDVTESDFQRTVLDLAKLRGWRYFHDRVAWRSDPGWPDLVLVRDRIVFAELKAERGKLTPAQESWIAALSGAGTEVYVWRPSDWESIQEVLR